MNGQDWISLIAGLPPDRAVFVAGACGMPTALLAALSERPEALSGRRIITSYLPGINPDDPSAGSAGPPIESIFPLARAGLRGADLIGLHYADTAHWLAGPASVGAALFQAAPDARGGVNLGLSADFIPVLAEAGVPLVAQVNPAHPALPVSPRLPAEALAATVTGASELATYDPGPISPVFSRIAGHVAGLLEEGDTVQLGLGKLQGAVLDVLLTSGLRVALHGGMLSTGVLDLVDAGQVTGMVTGTVLGARRLYDRAPGLAGLRMLPVPETHGADRLAAIPALVSVNSALSVDLLGQATSETVAGRQVSASGGLVDFHRAARASERGRAILALPATARGESRIVARHPAGTRVTVSAPEADIVVTEHGIARLADLTLRNRAKALINVAAPEHRDRLWAELEEGDP